MNGLLKMEMYNEQFALEAYEVESGKLMLSIYDREKNDQGYSIEVNTKEFLFLIGEVTKPVPDLSQ
jgi:hypothetical protein